MVARTLVRPGWKNVHGGYYAFFMFRVGSARTLKQKGTLPTTGARRWAPHRGGVQRHDSSTIVRPPRYRG